MNHFREKRQAFKNFENIHDQSAAAKAKAQSIYLTFRRGARLIRIKH